MKVGRPSNNKKTLSLEDQNSKGKHVTLELPKDIHRRIMEKKMDTGMTMHEILMELIEREFK